jgi:hypothetical protein
MEIAQENRKAIKRSTDLVQNSAHKTVKRRNSSCPDFELAFRDQTDWPRCIAADSVFGRCSFRNSATTDIISWFISVHPAKCRYIIGLGQDLFLPNAFSSSLTLLSELLFFETLLKTPPKKYKKLNSVAFSPQASYTDRATAACRRS